MQEKEEKQEIDWKELDLILRRWAVMSQWEKDQENYQNLKDEYDGKILRGYN